MTIAEAIAQAKALKKHAYEDETVLKWLNEIEGRIKKEVIDTHDDGDDVVFTGYTDATATTELIAPDPYSKLYIDYIMAQVDYYNADINRYNNGVVVFTNDYNAFCRYYNSEHMPKQIVTNIKVGFGTVAQTTIIDDPDSIF